MEDSDKLRRILRANHTIAVVGLSAQWHRPSFFAAKYMQEHGYRVIPVNPTYDTILGEKSYKRLTDIPEPVDMVNVFRRPHDIPPHLPDILAARPRSVWMQLGISHDTVAEELARAGIKVVQDR